MAMPSGNALLQVGLVALVLLAGCAGTFGSAGNATTTAPADAGDASDSAPDAPLYSTPLSAETIDENHVRALERAESFTLTTNYTVWSDAANAERKQSTRRVEANVTRNARLIEKSSQSGAVRDGTATVYVDETTAPFSRLERPAAETEYYRTSGKISTNLSEYMRMDTSQFESVNFTYVGQSSTPEATLYTYRADALSQVDTEALRIPPFLTNVTDVRVTLVVSQDGVVRSLDYRLNGTARSGAVSHARISAEFSAVGSTNVTRPDWAANVQ
jgi:hypothetical protein